MVLTASVQADITEYPFLARTIVTYTKNNEQGIEVRHKDEVVFKLDRASAEMPWYVLRNYSVPQYLNGKYGPMEVAWQRIYEIKILKLINRANPADITSIPLRIMTLGQLDEYVTRWELNVPVYQFYSVEKAREMVALRQQDLKGYERHYQEYKEGKQRNHPQLDTVRGSKEAATADAAEFEELDKKIPVKRRTGKKTAPAAEVAPSAAESAALADAGAAGEAQRTPPSTGDQGVAIADPFKGV